MQRSAHPERLAVVAPGDGIALALVLLEQRVDLGRGDPLGHGQRDAAFQNAPGFVDHARVGQAWIDRACAAIGNQLQLPFMSEAMKDATHPVAGNREQVGKALFAELGAGRDDPGCENSA